jgi:predicted Zn-dependent protease
MTRWIAFAGVIALAVAAIAWSERHNVAAEASPAAVLYLVADTKQELTRLPVHFTRMSDAEEIRIGDEIAKMYGDGNLEDEKKKTKSEIERYLTEVGGKLAVRAHRILPYKFHYVPNEGMVNAFSLPGGHVYVGAGLLAMMDSEDELAAVVGHEIEHIDHYHCADRAQQERALRRIPLGGLAAIPVFVFEAGYTKDQELEADREETRLAVEAGYSANGAVRMFEAMDRMYARYRQQRARPASPQEELSDVALQTIDGYFRSHPLPAERISQIQKVIATENWPARSERDLVVAYIFWTARAKRAMEAKKYPEAEQLAARSIKMRAVQGEAWEVEARAQFAQAEFVEAAESYRKLLELDPKQLANVESYAMALAAADRAGAPGKFRNWLVTGAGKKPRNADVELAGLNLLAGETSAARKYESDLRGNADGWAPDYLGELGWWYYLAGDYMHASQLLEEAVQQRPGDVKLWARRGWAQIEIRRYSDAIQTVNNGYVQGVQNERAMAQGVAYWQARERDSALRDYEQAVAGQPEWENQKWVKALYSPLVAGSVEEMKAERERQKKQKMAERR